MTEGMAEKEDRKRAEREYLWERRYKIVYKARLSALYHRERERFLSWVGKAVTAIALIGGSAAFVSVASPWIVKSVGLVIVLTTTVSLVFDLSGAARRHAELAARYERLLAEITRRGERDFEEDDLNTWEAEIHEIQAMEPPAYATLVRLCQNRLDAADGHPERAIGVPFWRRLLAQIYSGGGWVSATSKPKRGRTNEHPQVI